MNSKPRSTEINEHSVDELSQLDVSRGASSSSAPVDVSVAQAAKADHDDLAFAKAATLMIDSPQDVQDMLGHQVSADVSLKYIQGVVQSQRVYIVTNLLGGESQLLLQSQMVWTLGRNRDAALPLRDRALSRRHAVLLYVRDEGFYLVDLNSMNGSFINGVRIQHRQLLKDGDRIRLGGIDFSFFMSQGVRTIDPIHPEVLTRFMAPHPRSEEFMDFAALEEPEALFGNSSAGDRQ